MATVNIGSIKFTWQGAYNSSTAYAIDDIVSYNGSSYVCILASTGNLPTDTTYWNVMAQGGTDITSLTGLAQGDILYYNGTDWVRLGAGTSGQVLQTNGASANPSWATVSSDFVKLTSGNFSGSSSSVSIDGFYSSDYINYKLYLYNLENNNTATHFRFNFSGSEYSGSQYRGIAGGNQNNTGSHTGGQNISDWNANRLNLTNWGAANNFGDIIIMDIIDPQSTSLPKRIQYQTSTYNSSEVQVLNGHGVLVHNETTASTGVTIFSANGNNYTSTSAYALYGIK